MFTSAATPLYKMTISIIQPIATLLWRALFSRSPFHYALIITVPFCNSPFCSCIDKTLTDLMSTGSERRYDETLKGTYRVIGTNVKEERRVCLLLFINIGDIYVQCIRHIYTYWAICCGTSQFTRARHELFWPSRSYFRARALNIYIYTNTHIYIYT